jgi:hypothetical protein
MAASDVNRVTLSQAELLERAELAVQALVLSVRRSSREHGPRVAKLRIETVIKGTPRYRNAFAPLFPFARTIGVTLQPVARDAKGGASPGQWAGGYRTGDRIITHLVWNQKLSSYTTVSWNAVWQVPP